MSKDKSWYKRTHQFAPYTKADGQAVSDEFDAIQSSFDRIPEMRDDGKGFAVSPIIPTPTDPMHPVTYGMLTEAEGSVAESRKDVTEKAQQVDANTKTVSEKTEIVIEKSDSATQSASAALTSQQSANQSETMAKKWAANPIDEPVVDDKFSAFHYASKAAKSAEILATAESSAKSNAEIATQKAEEAARSADKARNIAGGKVYYEDVLEVPRASVNGDVGITTLSSDLYSDSDTEAATIGVVKSIWDKVKDQHVQAVNLLTSLEPENNGQLVMVKSYHYGGLTGGGTFIADMTDKTTPDNGGTVIVTSGGNRWKRASDLLLPNDLGGANAKDNIAFIHGITRIYGGNNLALDYKKEIDQFNVPESVIAIGRGSLANAVGAGQTIAIGGNALHKAAQSYSNIAIGETALENLQSSGSEYYKATKGTRNIAIGGNALQFLANGTRNVAIGRNAACGLQFASDCVAIGAGALSGENTNGWNKDVETWIGNSQENAKITAIGYNSLLYYNGQFSTALGGQSGTHLKTGDANTLLGFRTGMNLEIDVGWDGFVKTIYGQGDKGLQVDYTKQGNQLTVTIPDHKCVAGSTAYIRWDSGPAFPQPPHWHAWRQKVVAVTNNTVTFECPYDGDGGGKATIFWSLSQNKDTNTSRHNTFIGHTAGWQAKKSNNSVVVGSLAGALAEDISNAVVIGYNAGAGAARINNSVLIGSNASDRSREVNNLLSIADVVTGDLLAGRIGLHMPLDNAPLADLHLRVKGDAGSGRSKTTNGFLVESSQTASIHLDGNNAGNLDFEQGGVFKGGLRYSYSGKFMTVVMGGGSSWRFDESHRFYPVADNRNSLGTQSQKLKEVFITEPGAEENGDKAITAKWFRNQFSGNLSGNGWTKLPNGLILQWGSFSSGQGRTFNFPISFNQIPFTVMLEFRDSSIKTFASSYTQTAFSLYDLPPSLTQFMFFAIGR